MRRSASGARRHLGLGLAAFVSVVAPGDAEARLPLNIENVILQQGALRLESGLRYGSTRRAAGGQDAAAWLQQYEGSLRLRFGLHRDVEFQAGVTRGETLPEAGGPETPTGEVTSVELGVSWKISPDGDTPAVVLSGSVDVLERIESDLPLSREDVSGEVGVELYRSIDPVVLSLSAGYRYAGDLELGEAALRRGDSFYVAPRVNFAVNPRVTLIGGLMLTRERASTLQGRRVSVSRTRLEPLFGMGYLAGPRSTVFVRGRVGGEGAVGRISVDWVYRF